MAITSKGYTGTVNYADWSILTDKLGAQFAVFGADSFKVAPASGDRAVSVRPGEATGQGIRDVSDAVVTLTGAPVSSGDRWDMVSLRRTWGSTKASSLVLVQGAANKNLPAQRRTAVGEVVDHPLALVRFTAGQTGAQEVIDLRVWHGDGGILANDVLVREFLDRIGTVVRIKEQTWARVLDATGLPTWTEIAGGRLLDVLDVPIFDLPPSGALPNQGVTVWGLASQLVASVKFDDPGVPYRVQMYAQGFWGNELQDSGSRHDFDMLVGDQAIATWLPPGDSFWFGNWRSWSPPPSRRVFTGAQDLRFRARRISGNPYGAIRKAESSVTAWIYSA